MVSKWAGLWWWVRGRRLEQHLIFLLPQVFCSALRATFRNVINQMCSWHEMHTWAASQTARNASQAQRLLSHCCCHGPGRRSSPASEQPGSSSSEDVSNEAFANKHKLHYVSSKWNHNPKQNIRTLIEMIEHQMRYKNFISPFVHLVSLSINICLHMLCIDKLTYKITALHLQQCS